MRPDQLLYTVNISPKFRYVYIDNPKTGCSSLKSALVELEMRNCPSALDWYDWKVFHDRSVSPLKRLNDHLWGGTLQSLVSQKYRFITFVRNPYSRLLSCYRDKILGNKPHKSAILQRLGRADQAPDTMVSFDDFILAVTGQSDREMDPHWRVQSSQILYDIVNYHFIGRFESYGSHFRECFFRLGIQETDIPQLRHLHRTQPNAPEPYDKYYTKKLQNLVYERYRKDFENFDYAYELPTQSIS